MAPLVAQEASRPYFEYSAFYPAERAYTRMFGQLAPGDILLPSPMLAQTSPYVLLNFQIGPEGSVTSPQAPTDQMRRLAESRFTTREFVDAATARLALIDTQPGWKTLALTLPKPEDRPVPTAVALVPNNDNRADQQAAHRPEPARRQRPPAGQDHPEPVGHEPVRGPQPRHRHQQQQHFLERHQHPDQLAAARSTRWPSACPAT